MSKHASEREKEIDNLKFVYIIIYINYYIYINSKY